jgi:hypothetical protein
MPTLTPEVNVSFAEGQSVPELQPVDSENDIERALAQVKANASRYEKFAKYYAGDHRLVFATEKFRNAFGDLFTSVADNLCEVVVDSMADRLQVTGFNVEEGTQSLADEARKIWQANRMDERAGQVHREALRAGDGYALVWPDPTGEPVIWPQMAALVTVRYDDERPENLLWAAKVWRKEKKIRLNMYYADRIEKWITQSSAPELPSRSTAFVPFPEDPRVDNPFGAVPIFHFANNAWVGQFGRSELVPVAPLQDALNKALCDMLVSMEFNAYPQRWGTGIEFEVDEKTGKPKEPFRAGIDRVWAVANEMAKLGQFEPSQLEGFLQVQDSLRVEIARVAGLPPHYVEAASGANMSGEALKTAEARFVKKIKARQGAFGNSWENALKFALKISRLGGDKDRLTTQWEPAAPITEKEHLETLLQKKDLGVTTRQLLLEVPYGEEEVNKMVEEKEAEMAAQRRLFNAGMTGGGE